jgi:hypothetical protein
MGVHARTEPLASAVWGLASRVCKHHMALLVQPSRLIILNHIVILSYHYTQYWSRSPSILLTGHSPTSLSMINY